MPPFDSRKVITLALTSSDEGQCLTYDTILLKDVNIHVYGADVYYGDPEHVMQAAQASATPICSIIRANAVVWFENLLLKELYFKSYVNATPGYVVLTGTLG